MPSRSELVTAPARDIMISGSWKPGTWPSVKKAETLFVTAAGATTCSANQIESKPRRSASSATGAGSSTRSGSWGRGSGNETPIFFMGETSGFRSARGV